MDRAIELVERGCSGPDRPTLRGSDDPNNTWRRSSVMPNKVTGANSRYASQFESRGLRRRALVVESHGRHLGGAAVAQF